MRGRASVRGFSAARAVRGAAPSILMRKNALLLLSTCCVASLFAACQDVANAYRGNLGVSAVQFPDVPAPHGMGLREHEHMSHSLQVGEYRYGEFEYAGPLTVREVSAYMRERMPQHSWEMVADDAPSPDVQVMKFRRGKYVAECTVSRDKALTRMRVKVQTRVPTSQ